MSGSGLAAKDPDNSEPLLWNHFTIRTQEHLRKYLMDIHKLRKGAGPVDHVIDKEKIKDFIPNQEPVPTLHIWIMSWCPDLKDCGGLICLAEQRLAALQGLLGSQGLLLCKESLGNVVVITQITGFPPLPGYGWSPPISPPSLASGMGRTLCLLSLDGVSKSHQVGTAFPHRWAKFCVLDCCPAELQSHIRSYSQGEESRDMKVALAFQDC
ncbi:not available [Pontoporia blainvillei]|uniref:Not available n=1 Tax=Pontoporia blainvillei TaxID=48723 RepID=A0ABX0S598_PONBL|nr:not available [Pontoporia blainvillei]